MLDQIIDHVAAKHQPVPIDRQAGALTPRGHAALSVIRLKRQILALGAEDRAWIVELVREMADDVELPTTA